MPAVVRVKRRIDEEPHSAFVLNGKKRRLESNEGAAAAEEELPTKDEISTVLKFAGTIKEQDDTATTQIAARLNKSDAKQLVQEKTTSRHQQLTNPTERSRRETRQSQSEQRFRVVNCQRTTLDAASIENEKNGDEQEQNSNGASTSSAITIVDIEPTTTAMPVVVEQQQQFMPDFNEMPADSDTGYVYDLYLPENEQQAAYVDMMDDNYLSVRLFDDLVYDDCYDNADDENDSEDSNHENYFTNDYPDEEDDKDMFSDACGNSSGSSAELCNALNVFYLGDDDDSDFLKKSSSSSSDDDEQDFYEDPYIHSVDADDEYFVDDVDYVDIADRYGDAYARYRRRVLKELDKSSDCDADDSDSGEEHYSSASEN